MEELWLPVPDFEGYYEVSNLGRIKSLSRVVPVTNRVLKEKFNSMHLKRDGYHSVLLRKPGVKKTIQLHRIVAKTFIKNTDNKRVVNHIDGNKLNNCVNNLEWVSHRENSCHYYRSINSGTPVGVFKLKKYNKFLAHAHVDGKKVFLGYHKTQEEAYNARIEYFKSNNILNKYV